MIAWAKTGAVQDPGQPVVVGGGNGVELVVVAAGTGHCQTQEGLGQNVDLVVYLVGPGFEGVNGAIEAFAQPEKTGTDRRLPVDPRRAPNAFPPAGLRQRARERSGHRARPG